MVNGNEVRNESSHKWFSELWNIIPVEQKRIEVILGSNVWEEHG